MCKKKIIAFFCASPTQLSFRPAPSAHPGLTERVVGTQAAPKTSLCILPPYKWKNGTGESCRSGLVVKRRFRSGRTFLVFRAFPKYCKLSDAQTSAVSPRPRLSGPPKVCCSEPTPEDQKTVAHSAPNSSIA